MTTEEKAKAYDIALDKIKMLLGTGSDCSREELEYVFPELKESEDEKIRKRLIEKMSYFQREAAKESCDADFEFAKSAIAWLEKQREQNQTLPKWKYKKDGTPLLRDSLILNKYGCVAKSPSGALVSDVWVIDYDELAKLPKEEFEKQRDRVQPKVELTKLDKNILEAAIAFVKENNHFNCWDVHQNHL